jgi:hypothetical protein
VRDIAKLIALDKHLSFPMHGPEVSTSQRLLDSSIDRGLPLGFGLLLLPLLAQGRLTRRDYAALTPIMGARESHMTA